jgi:hypothetical protein
VVFIMVRNAKWVRLFCGSWDGLKWRDDCMSMSDVIFVDCMFFCCILRWPLLVASDLAKCLVTRKAVRPGQDSKWARLMARKRRQMGRGCTVLHVGTLQGLLWWRCCGWRHWLSGSWASERSVLSKVRWWGRVLQRS